MRFTTKLCTVLASVSGFWSNLSNKSRIFFYFKNVIAVTGKTLKTFGLASSCVVLAFHLLHDCVLAKPHWQKVDSEMCTVSINVCWCDCSSFRTVHEEWYFPTTQSSSLACFSSGLGSKCPFSSRSKTVSCLVMLRGWGMSVQLLLLCFALNPPKWYLGSAVVGAAGCSVWRSGSPCCSWITCSRQSLALSSGTVVSFHHLNSTVGVSPMTKTLCGLFFSGLHRQNISIGRADVSWFVV